MIRRYSPFPKMRRNTSAIPPALRAEVLERDGTCIGRLVEMPGACFGRLEIDHIRASGALGKKSRTEADNLVALCSTHHRVKTLEGRKWRPVLIAHIAKAMRQAGLRPERVA